MPQYDLETKKIIEKIKEKGHKRVLLQFADGLKPESKSVVDTIEEETGAECIIWLGSCFGHCDIPLGLAPLKIDLVVQYGHNIFVKDRGGW